MTALFSNLALALLVVVLAALWRRERRRVRALRGDYIERVSVLRGRLKQQKEESEELRARLLLSTLRAGDSTCMREEEGALARPPRREYLS